MPVTASILEFRVSRSQVLRHLSRGKRSIAAPTDPVAEILDDYSEGVILEGDRVDTTIE